jgi:hypothetical protein
MKSTPPSHYRHFNPKTLHVMGLQPLDKADASYQKPVVFINQFHAWQADNDNVPAQNTNFIVCITPAFGGIVLLRKVIRLQKHINYIFQWNYGITDNTVKLAVFVNNCN